MFSRSRRSASAFSAMLTNSSLRWLISMTDRPLPCQSSISSRAFCNTASGKAAGPAQKLNLRLIRLHSQSKILCKTPKLIGCNDTVKYTLSLLGVNRRANYLLKSIADLPRHRRRLAYGLQEAPPDRSFLFHLPATYPPLAPNNHKVH